MKITNLTTEQMELQEGNTSGRIVGIAFTVAGALAGIFLRDANRFAIWIALAMFLIGIALILFASAITVNFDKKSGQLRYEKKRLVGSSNASYAIADIFRIETRKQWQMQNQGSGDQATQQPALVAQSVIVFKNGKELALDHQKTSSTTQIGSAVIMGGQGRETALASQVATFLAVPFEEIMPPNMSSGLNINITDAS